MSLAPALCANSHSYGTQKETVLDTAHVPTYWKCLLMTSGSWISVGT